MKVFIVSMALCIIGIEALVFGWDMNSYSYLQTHLKALAESTAAAAAVNFNLEEFEDSGDIVFYQSEVEGFVEYFVFQASKDMTCFQNGSICVEELVLDSTGDKVGVCLSYTSNYDLFRSPFKSEKTLVHMSCYEWVTLD